jgi:hypothetical protein
MKLLIAPAAKKPTGMARETIPITTDFLFSVHNSVINTEDKTSKPPIPNPVKNLQIHTCNQELPIPVSNPKSPKQAMDNASDLDLPMRSPMTPHSNPPNIHPIMNTALIHALASCSFSSGTFPDKSVTTTGNNTDINMERMPLKKVARNKII